MSLLLPVLLRVECSWPPRPYWGRVSPCKVMHKVQNCSGLLVELFPDVCTHSHIHYFKTRTGPVQQQNQTRLKKQNSPQGFTFSSDILVPPTSTHISIVNEMQAEHILHLKEVGLEPVSITKKKGKSQLIVTQNYLCCCRKQKYFIVYFLFVWSAKRIHGRERYFKREWISIVYKSQLNYWRNTQHATF